MDESRLTPMSQPYVIVSLNRIGYRVSTTFEDQNDSHSPGTHSDMWGALGNRPAADYKPGIVSLNIEGSTSITRKSVIKIADPTTEFTKMFLRNSAIYNSDPTKGYELTIYWGWKYLRPERLEGGILHANSMKYSDSYANRKDSFRVDADIGMRDTYGAEMSAMTLKSRFDIDENGVTQLEIETMEMSNLSLASASFIVPIDLINWQNIVNNRSISNNGTTSLQNSDITSNMLFINKLQTFINKSESLKHVNGGTSSPPAFQVEFDFSGDILNSVNDLGRGTSTVSGMSRLQETIGGIDISFNDSVDEFILRVLSKVTLPTSNPGSFEIVGNKTGAFTFNSKEIDMTTIIYGFRKEIKDNDAMIGMDIVHTLCWGNEQTTDNSEGASKGGEGGLTKEGTREVVKPGSNSVNMYFNGANPSRRSRIKYLVSWSSDLNSKQYLHFLAKNKTASILNKFDQKALEFVMQKLNNGEPLNFIGSAAGSGSIPSSMPLIAGYNPATATGGGSVDSSSTTREEVGKMSATEKSSVAQVVSGLTDNINRDITASSGSIEVQLGSIVANNVFKATATIMGDPAYGSVNIQPFKKSVYTDFSQMWTNNNLHAFSKKWMITKIMHKIEGGSYLTDIELLTFPPPEAAVDRGVTPPADGVDNTSSNNYSNTPSATSPPPAATPAGAVNAATARFGTLGVTLPSSPAVPKVSIPRF